MRSQRPRGTTVGSYRCSTTSVHGRCPAPSSVSLLRLDDYVLEQFLAHAGELRLHQVATADDAIDERATAAAEAGQSYRQTFTNVELRQRIGSADHDRMVAALREEWQRALADIPEAPVARSETFPDVDLAELVAELQRRGDIASLRELLGSAIQAVFVWPAASRARNLPIEDRVRIVWRDEDPIELPRGASGSSRAPTLGSPSGVGSHVERLERPRARATFNARASRVHLCLSSRPVRAAARPASAGRCVQRGDPLPPRPEGVRTPKSGVTAP
jgi:hypothetical protein